MYMHFIKKDNSKLTRTPSVRALLYGLHSSFSTFSMATNGGDKTESFSGLSKDVVDGDETASCTSSVLSFPNPSPLMAAKNDKSVQYYIKILFIL